MKKIVLITGLLVTPAFAEQAAIDIDGRFDDWSGITAALVDPTGDVSPGALDIGRVWLADDPDHLAIRIEASAEFDLRVEEEGRSARARGDAAEREARAARSRLAAAESTRK